MSVRESDPANHGVIVPSTDTLYAAAFVDVTKEPMVFGTPAIPNIPGTDRKRFMMYEFIGAWSNVYYSSGLRQNQVNKTNFIMVSPDFTGELPKIPDSVVVRCATNQTWLAIRIQTEALDDLPKVHAIQEQCSLTPLSMYGKPYTPPAGVVNSKIPTTPGPSPQVNAMDGKKFFVKASEWFNKVPFPKADQAAGVDKILAEIGIKHGQKFDYESLSAEQKKALDIAVKKVQDEFREIEAKPASIGPLKNGWVIPDPATGNFGTNYRLRAAIAFVGFGANLTADALYPLLVQDSKGKLLDGGKKYTLTFAKGQLPPAGAFWSVTMYQDHFLVPNKAKKYAVSSWMNPKTNSDGSVTIYMQPTSPGADLERNWLPSSAKIPGMTPLMRLYWPLPDALNGKWVPPPAVEVAD
jgi:hypothetical protein